MEEEEGGGGEVEKKREKHRHHRPTNLGWPCHEKGGIKKGKKSTIMSSEL